MFCNQCGKQIPDNSAVCPMCGAPQQAQPQMQPQMQQPQMQQPQMQQPYGQPQMQQGYGQPMGYGMPQKVAGQNPITKTYADGQDFVCKGMFNVKMLTMKIRTMNLIEMIAALFCLLGVLLPCMSFTSSYDYWTGASKKVNRNFISHAGNMKFGWLALVFIVGAIVFAILRLETLALLCDIGQFLTFICLWTKGSAYVAGKGSNLSIGFYFYLIGSIALLAAPFIWSKLKDK